VPLETERIPFKYWLKIFSGAGWSYKIKMIKGIKKIWRHDGNILRNEYNQKLRKEYNKSGALFDLAKVESTYPDGRRSTFEKNGKSYYCLVPDYTDDGGHLNEIGRKMVAEQFLILLAELK
jgi:hypothetical protein